MALHQLLGVRTQADLLRNPKQGASWGSLFGGRR